MENIHYAVLDIGTTSIRCFVYNQKFDIISSSSKDIKVLIPKTGYHEIDHEEMFQDVLYVIRESVKISGLSFDQIVLGISVQRSTFTTWSKSSGKYFHNFITWKDIRADAIVNKWNLSYRLGLIKFSSKCVHALTQSSRFLAGSVIKLMNSQVVPRLLWVVENNLNVKDSYKGDDLVMGTIDSYLLQRLRSGSNNEMHEVIEPLIEVTNATVTGIFDPFTVSWANWIMSLFSLKPNIFPKIAYNSDDFGEIHESYFGTKVKIVGIMGDQPASMFGNCCFNRGDAKITLGTGAFFDINTGEKCHASILGLYPLVAWKLHDQNVNYCVEAASHDTATIINWGVKIGLYSDPSESGIIAETVESSNGVYFIPAFSGLSAPVNDYKATSGFIGITANTTKAHMTRAILESIVFRVTQLIQASQKETDYRIKILRIDGGVSKSDFICQSLADLNQIVVERSANVENSSLGIAFLCAYNLKLATMSSLKKSYKSGKVFAPKKENHEFWIKTMINWEKALERYKKWY